jgi:hypothetical protein
MTESEQTFEGWLRENPAPNLLKFIAHYGDYEAIPTQAWTEFDNAKVEWAQRRKSLAAQEPAGH